MKLRYFYPCLLLAGMAVTLTACSNEDLMTNSGALPGETVFVSLNVDRSKAETRTIINEVETADGIGLSNVWAKGDKVTLVNAQGTVVGDLTLEGEGGSSDGVFSGMLTIADGEYDVWYLGAASDEKTPYASFDAEGQLVNALASANAAVSGKFADLNRADLMTNKVQIKVSDSKAIVSSDVTLAAQMAMAHFNLSGTGIAEALAAQGATLKFAYGDYSYSISDVAADVYVPMIPGTYNTYYSFTLTSGGKTYTYSRANENSKPIVAGLYYCGAKNADGSSAGISVTLAEQPDQPTDPRYEEYANEDPRNPLHKFAKYNLTRGENNLNVFVDESDKYGALYQWGRYYGFIDVTSKSGFGKYSLTSTAYSQFADALGEKTVNGSDIWGFEMHDANGTEMYRNPNYPSSGLESLPICVGFNYTQNYSGTFFDYPYFYTSKDHIVTDRPYYMMSGDPQEFISLLRSGSGTTATYLDEFSTPTDYWVAAFETEGEDGGEKWAERSDAQGFAEDKVNPCPDGWRLPSSSEMQEILPDEGLYEVNGDLSSMLNNYTELRTSKEGYKYAIRWNYNGTNSYIEIEAVVVDDSYTNVSQFTDEFWTSHSGDKVVRQFPFTGGIRPFCGNVYGNYTYDTIICRPIGMGKPSLKAISLGWRTYVGLVDPNESISINQYFGGYWVDEKGLAMKFCAKNYEREVNGNVREAHSEYTRLRLEETGPAFGMAIRPVMNK